MRKTTLVRSLFTFLLFALVSFGVKGQESQVIYYEDFNKVTLGSPIVNNVTSWSDPLISPSSSIWLLAADGAGATSENKYEGASGKGCLISTRSAGEVVFNFEEKLTRCSDVTLSFGYRHPFAGEIDDMKLLFSKDGGKTWETENKLSANNGQVGWYFRSIKISDEYLSNFAFKFIVPDLAPNGAFRIDDVKLTGIAQGYVNPPTFSVFSKEIESGSKVVISSVSSNTTIHYTINGGPVQVGQNPLTVVPEKYTTIVAWANDGYNDSEKVTTSYSVLERSVLIGHFEGDFYALTAQIINSKSLYGTKLEMTVDNEPILPSLDLIWELVPVEGINRFYIRDPKTQRYVTNETNLNQPRLYLTSNIKTVWTWNELNGRFELFDDNNTLRTIWYNKDNNFKAFSENEIMSLGFAESFRCYTPNDFLYKLNGSYTAENVNSIIKRVDLKWIDLSEAVIDQPSLVNEPANPNCLIYTTQELAFEKNVVKNGVCNYLDITDKKPFGMIHDFMAYNMNYVRNAWQDGGWETIILPYPMDKMALPKDYIFDEYIGTSSDYSTVEFKQVAELQANKPYLMKYVGANIGNWQNECAFINEFVSISSERKNAGFTGVYSRTSTADKYILGTKNGVTIFGKGTANSYVMPFRAYLDIALPAGGAPMKVVHLPSDVTGLDENEVLDWYVWSNEIGEIIVRTSVEKLINIVSIEGRLIRSVKLIPGEHVLGAFNSGFYIINGKKIMVK